MTRPGVVAGIFVGGSGSRMGGVAKGLLVAPGGGSLVDRWRALLGDLGVRAVLVGEHPAYSGVALEALADEPRGIGPLGGLVALLRCAGPGRALALACDMPFVSRGLVEHLLAFAPSAPVVAPRKDGLWEPLCAAYDAAAVLPIAIERAAQGARSLQGLLEQARAVELPLDDARFAELRDWDHPDDR